MQPYQHSTKIGLHHTDAAGILFYSQIFSLAYEAFDAWLDSLGVGVAWIIQKSDFLFPYVHAEADYLTGMTVGERLTIYVTVEKIGRSSLTVAYDFQAGEAVAARVKTVHVAISKETKNKIDLPEKIKSALNKFMGS